MNKKYAYTINGSRYEVEVNGIENGIAKVAVNGTYYDVRLEDVAPVAPAAPATPMAAPVASPAPAAPVATPAPAPAAAPVVEAPAPTPAPAPAPAAGGSPVMAPLPGVVIKMIAKVGDTVKKGDKLLVLEAMKMENDVKAPKAGTIASVQVAEGDSVQEGTTLITIA